MALSRLELQTQRVRYAKSGSCRKLGGLWGGLGDTQKDCVGRRSPGLGLPLGPGRPSLPPGSPTSAWTTRGEPSQVSETWPAKGRIPAIFEKRTAHSNNS